MPLLVFVALGSAELFWRSAGHRPSVVDDLPLWSYHRRQISASNSQVVLLGASRMLFGFSTPTFSSQFPHRPISVLAVTGKFPITTLRDLAEDETFNGMVICATKVDGLLSKYRDHQLEYVNHAKRAGPSELVESSIRSRLQSRVAVLNPNVGLFRVVEKLLREKTLPAPLHVVTRTDRTRPADFSILEDDELMKLRAKYRRGSEVSVEYAEWENDAAAIGALVRKIKSRGGKVVFVRFPTTAEHWKLDEQAYPKQQYWDQLAALTGAHTVHFKDVPTLDRFTCPDESHLDCRDTPAFTAALLDELQRIGAL